MSGVVVEARGQSGPRAVAVRIDKAFRLAMNPNFLTGFQIVADDSFFAATLFLRDRRIAGDGKTAPAQSDRVPPQFPRRVRRPVGLQREIADHTVATGSQKGRVVVRPRFDIDARHGLKDTDNEVLATLDKAAVNYQVVLTKADEVKEAALADLIAATTAALAKHPAAFPQVLATSARDGAGIADLRAAIARLVKERGG